jgi:hypothetical protein
MKWKTNEKGEGVRSFGSIQASTDTDVVFPDLLNDMHQYEYKAFAKVQIPRMLRKEGKLRGIDVKFMETVAEKQNAKLSVREVEDDITLINEIKHSLFFGRSDICLTTGFVADEKKLLLNPVNTFDTTGYCVLIPIPPSPTYIDFIIDPYDGWSWFLLGLLIAVFILLWKIIGKLSSMENFNSPLDVAFRLFGGILGQSVALRTTRSYQRLLIVIFVAMMFVFGNVYQSMLTSLMTVPHHGQKLTSVNQVFEHDHDYNYCTFEAFKKILMDSIDDEKVKSRIWTSDLVLYLLDYDAAARNKTVFIFRCELMEILLSLDKKYFKNGQLSDFYYKLQEVFLVDYENLLTSIYGPFSEKLNDFSLRLFESGIKQHWKRLFPSFKDDAAQDATRDDFLRMNDFIYIFIIYGIGVIIALVTFIIEVLWWNLITINRRFAVDVQIQNEV